MNCLPLIYIFLPDNLFYPFFLRMVLKLPITGHAPIAFSAYSGNLSFGCVLIRNKDSFFTHFLSLLSF